MRNPVVIAATVLALLAGPAQAQISDGIVKIGVLNDQSGLYADLAGQGSVVAPAWPSRTSGPPPRA